MPNNEIENLKNLKRALENSIKLAQFNLINFSDAYQKYLITLMSNPKATNEHANTFGEQAESLVKSQNEFATFKSKIEITLASSFLR